jgi:pimeloyl-ACP methyl ester carboxylesterase
MLDQTHNGIEISYRDSGTGAPVIALHGSASSGAQWRSLSGCLEGRFRIITPDLPGSGRSERLPGSQRPSLAAMIRHLSDIFDLCEEPVHLVGHSFGGALALKAALMMPEQIRSLTLIEPASFHVLKRENTTTKSPFSEVDSVASTMRSFAGEGDAWNAMAHFIDFWNGAGAWQRSSHGLRQHLARLTGSVLEDFASIEAEPDGLAAYSRITCPVLAVMGSQSPAASLRTTELVSEALPDARLVVLANAGHMAPLTDPHVIDPMIAEHLLAVDRASGEIRDLHATQPLKMAA